MEKEILFAAGPEQGILLNALKNARNSFGFVKK
jgi:hypothetical protein